MTDPLYLPAMSVSSCFGLGKAVNAEALFAGRSNALVPNDNIILGRRLVVGAISEELPPLSPELSGLDSRNNRLLKVLIDEISNEIETIISRYGRDRVAVILGTSTSGIAEGEAAIAQFRRDISWPAGFHYEQQETGSPAAFVSRALGLTGPAYVIATACSASAKTFASARRLIRHGLADAAIVGGADTLCRLTLAGFASLEAMSPKPCNPFSANRSGITIGEGGALFLLSREPSEIALLGIGEGSDAYHISAPEPNGQGAREAMERALADASLAATDIAYINLHGTATILNDAMESRAIFGLFGAATPCSSTKALTGHTLGAAGAIEAAFIWLMLSHQWNLHGQVPPQVWDEIRDPSLQEIALASAATRLPTQRDLAALSNSFAFGGNNCSLIFGRRRDP